MRHLIQTPLSRTLAVAAAVLLVAACGKSKDGEVAYQPDPSGDDQGAVAYQPDPSGDDTGLAAGAGSASKITAVWKQLAKYEDAYLKTWKGAFANPKPEPRDVLDAFNEVGYAVTGAGGFWRNKAKNQWFGCGSDGDTAICQALADHEAEFAKWDDFQKEISELADGKEKAFIARNHKKMLSYLKSYVPASPNESGMKATGFFKGSLAEALANGDVTASDDDL